MIYDSMVINCYIGLQVFVYLIVNLAPNVKLVREYIKAKTVSKLKCNISHFRHQNEIAETKALLPFDQMTMEDVYDAYPDQALDSLNKPTFWPHTPDEQEGYVDPEKQAQAQTSH